ncbi:heavy-metal-associated domain-containing protein [Desulfoferrobacter suflitae]|uniref:heavy-metal-associated domain-containing protein n=1 Tax=Desulfoferrobacter suflitae TaxID=2865782 RepID=UPI002164DDD1|nr:heavy-metal-associated domain-containing protein [Desulfoferrobacter suflitae]MCK8603359.1 heavy-metal-associated domain-containing protein [Desulfoferrobacter suflitae]
MRTVKIRGMSCEHCAKAVIKGLSEIEGISNVTVDLARGEASFEEAEPVEESVLRDRIQKAGYELG